jgi:competence protein ComEA
VLFSKAAALLNRAAAFVCSMRLSTYTVPYSSIISREKNRGNFLTISNRKIGNGGSSVVDFTRREQIFVGLILLVIIIASGIVFWPKETAPVVAVTPPVVERTKETPAQPKEVVVYVSGAVGNPGVVKLPNGSRVVDALQAQGGMLPMADAHAVNLAAVLVDGQQVHIPMQGEPMATSAVGTLGGKSATGKVSINTADAGAFDTLPGIGPATAQKIVEYRKTHGSFRTLDELKEVPGIGDSKFQALKDKITL